MKTILVICLHFVLNTFFGLGVLHLLGYRDRGAIRIAQGFVIGMLVESALGFLCLYQSIEEYWSLVLVAILGIAFFLYSILKLKANPVKFTLPTLQKLSWIEGGFMLLIAQKVISSFYALVSMPLYFDDAMTHWNGRGRAIYGNANWSIYSDSMHFMGKQLGYKEYPFLSSIWRANTAHMNGSWNDLLSRADGFILSVLLLVGVYQLAKYFGAVRWMRLGAAFVVTALPLQFVHVTSGYSELTLQAISVLALLALLKKEWTALGLMVGAMIFTKNEGLMLYFPLLTGLVLLSLVIETKLSVKQRLLSFAGYLLGALLLVFPWLSFKLSAGIPFSTPLKAENYYHEGALRLFVDAMFNSASSSIFWIVFFIGAVMGIPVIMKSRDLTKIALLVLALLAALVYVFCFTGAHVFLVNQMTIHRSLLQVAPLACLLIVGIVAKSTVKKKSSDLLV